MGLSFKLWLIKIYYIIEIFYGYKAYIKVTANDFIHLLWKFQIAEVNWIKILSFGLDIEIKLYYPKKIVVYPKFSLFFLV